MGLRVRDRQQPARGAPAPGPRLPGARAGTKIRAKYLRALEDENFEELPAATYVKGFLRTYADYLGLDGQLYVDEYNVRYSHRRRGARAADPRQLLADRPRQRHRRLESNVVWFALIGIAVVTALVIVAWRFGGSGHQSLPLSRPAAPAPARVGGLLVRAGRATRS